MATVNRHQKGSSATQTPDGWAYNEIVSVTELTGEGLILLRNAAQASGIPPIGAGYPGMATVTLREKTPTGEAGKAVTMNLSWRDHENTDTPDDQDLTVGTSLQGTETNVDVDGNLMSVEYDGRDQSGMVSVDRPHSTIHVSRTEIESPGPKSREYVGKVNSAHGFNLALADSKARSWRCNSIIGRSTDGGRTYRVDYDFEFAAERKWVGGGVMTPGWDLDVSYIDPETGRIPDGVINGGIDVKIKALRTYQVYAEKNFNMLHLT